MYTNLKYVLILCILVNLSSAAQAAEKPVPQFKRVKIDGVFRSEGVAVGDFNKDGKNDIAAGSVYYAAPDWKMHAIREQAEQFDPANYSTSFCNWAEDLNGDGWQDLIVVDFPGKETWWFENPQTAAGPWRKHVITPVTNNESPTFLDVDGDGKRELLLGFSPDPKQPDGPERQMAIARRTSDPTKLWTLHAFSAKEAPGCMKYSHGLGVGDINKDSHNDIVVTAGWWEAPADKSQVEWKFHAVNFGEPAAQMYVYDFDGDGDNDVLSTSAHKYGIWWHEQSPQGWTTHEIDKSVSETHSVNLVDMNGDGLLDFVTGKRWWSHARREPGADQPAVVRIYLLSRENGKPKWTPHDIDLDSGVGTQFEIADVNGDNLLDIVTSNKKGTQYFEQVK